MRLATRLLPLALTLALALAAPAAAKTTLKGHYSMKRTSLKRVGGAVPPSSYSDDFKPVMPVPSGKRENWEIDTGCKPGPRCLLRDFKYKGEEYNAPKVFDLRKFGGAFGSNAPHALYGRCFLGEAVKHTVRLRITKTKRKGRRKLATRIKGTVTWSWETETAFDSATGDPNAVQHYAGSAKATYKGKYSGPIFTGGFPGGGRLSWERTSCTSV